MSGASTAQPLGEAVLERFAQIKSARASWESHWQEIAERVLPRQADFLGSTSVGEKRSDKVFDSTAPLALERFSAIMESMLTPRGRPWHSLRCRDEALERKPEVKAWLEHANQRLIAFRAAPRANFASQQHEVYMSLGAFGTGCLYLDELPGRGLRYRAVHLSEIFVAEDEAGRIDTVYRRFFLTARQALQRWPQAFLPRRLREAATQAPERRFEFLHAVEPHGERDLRRRDARGMPYRSVTLSLDEGQVLQEGGYRGLPYLVSRYVTAPREIYGRSPAMLALPDIKLLNEMSRTVVRAAHKAVDPPLLLHDDGVLGVFSTRPNALNYGGVTDEGRPLAIPLQSASRLDVGMEMLEQRRRSINDAFLVSLFRILAEQPNMTATEVLQRVHEKGALLAPAIGRQQSEALAPMIERELELLEGAGLLPPRPPGLEDLTRDLWVEFQSPVARSHRIEELETLARAAQLLQPFLAIAPDLITAFDAQAVARLVVEASGLDAVLKAPPAAPAMPGGAA